MSPSQEKSDAKTAVVSEKTDDGYEKLGYLELPKGTGAPDDLSWMTNSEGFKEKFIRKTKQNPFVPLGLGLTIGALSYGLWQMKTGNKIMSQKMMRLRVAAQSFTVVALLVGVMYHSNKPKT